MKKIDDKEIINQVKNDSNYEIKTTSASILRKYHAQKNEVVEKKHNKSKYFLFGGFGALAISAMAIATVFFVNNNGSNNGDNPLNPSITIKNESLKNELAIFSLFSTEESQNGLQNLIKMKIRDEETITQDGFEDLCKTYDDTNRALEGLSRDTKISGQEYNDQVDGDNTIYKYKNDIRYEDNDELVASIYFNDEQILEQDDDEIESRMEALYVTNQEMYKLFIEKEIEDDESEYVLTFMPKSNSEYYYVVEKEQEIDGLEKEEAYSYTTYKDNSSEENFLEKIKYEKEESKGRIEFELEVEKNGGDKKYKYKDVVLTSSGCSFVGSMEGENIESIDDIKVQMLYQNDGRLYKYNDLEIVLK